MSCDPTEAIVEGAIDEQELLERIFQNDQAQELLARLLNHTDQNKKAA